MNRKTVCIILGATFVAWPNGATSGEWKPAEGRLMTQWARDVTPANVLPSYPRPQMVRDRWLNLNGLWEFAITEKDVQRPKVFPERILVPFPVESALSGMMKRIDENHRIWYRRMFTLPDEWKSDHVLLHFGAADWETTVYLNGHSIGTHRGGYDGFHFDISDHLTKQEEQELVVSIWDPTDVGGQAVGKQKTKPGGIWYTPTSGIWQTVWLEPVPTTYIASLRMTPDVDAACLMLNAKTEGGRESSRVEAIVSSDGREIARTTGGPGTAMRLSIPRPKLWSPHSPFLYDLRVILKTPQGEQLDQVDSYFAMRKISLGQDEHGVTRMLLNGEPLFQIGVLDQGFWPDGLYTSPTEEALRYDVESTKRMGFNLARKHVKVEPDRWYYWCDRLGLLVWQDMPNARNEGIGDKEQFERELTRMIEGLHNHPCIVMWVPFNEGWGQYDTSRIVNLIKSIDASRLVNNASGWHDKSVGDVHDIHAYPGPDSPKPEPSRAAVLGEFGGLGLRVKDHSWHDEGWGYALLEDREGLAARYEELLEEIYRLRKKPGLSAAVYTQLTDVETESNGLLTYDRAVVKIDADRVATANDGYMPPRLVGPSEIFVDETGIELDCVKEGATIRYTLDGSEPTRQSLRYEGPFRLTETTAIKARAFWYNGKQSPTRTITVRKVEPIPPVDVEPTRLGVRVDYYEGKWEALPAFADLTPTATAIAGQIDLDFAQRDQFFALRFKGLITVPTTGVYALFLTSDDGAKLFVGDQEIADNDGLHGPREQRGLVALQAGTHPITVLYFQGPGGKALEVSYLGPGIAKQPIPPSMLSCRATD
ncbi:MAG: chitobiase/beta-hexosaminidase C-terminal domain-containing protein [Phycisphaerales bacterium]|nr:MAG: chitobiase/beta-hexosaminidase C-terminal domain-containing protein [Phycisphaerales bacterium]